MADKFSRAERSEIMRRVHSSNTSPEIIVRQWLHKNGYRFRLHRKDLPGTPDIVMPKHKTAIFVNGCFWHRHEGCKRASTPQTNIEYWEEKFARNMERDKTAYKELAELGWNVVVLWECQIQSGIFEKQLLSILGV